ncbi:zinc finger protein 70-like [Scleropages formosus]|nr:zinc finger protein 70-like [Scleropages formosus]
MAGGTVMRWVISEDGSHLIRRDELEEEFLKGVEDQSHRATAKQEAADQPVTSPLSPPPSSSVSSRSTCRRNAVPLQLPVSYPCAYCDICFTASHYLEKHFKRSHRKQYLEMLRVRDAAHKLPLLSRSARTPSSAALPPRPSLRPARPKSAAGGLEGSGRPLAVSCNPTPTDKLANCRQQVPRVARSKFSSVVSSRCSKTAVAPLSKQVAVKGLAQSCRPPSGAQDGRKAVGRSDLSPFGLWGCKETVGEDAEGLKELHCQEDTVFLCNDCGQSFSSFSLLNSHRDQAHKGQGRVKGGTEEDDEEYEDDEEEEEEEEELGETLYLCAECGLSFPCLERLQEHQSLHDPSSAGGEQEGREEEEKGDEDLPSRVVSESHTCPNCHKVFKTARYLKTHMKIHSGQVPYHCDECDKPFTQLGDLKTHRRTHTGERPYQCAQCGKCFGRSGTLKKHWRTHTGETPYVCDVCGKQFNQLGALKTHERIHTGLRPYFCSRCSQHFTYSYQLKRHRCVHADKS